MAALGGMLAAAILKVVGDQVGSLIGGQIALQMNLDKDLKKMNMALDSVKAVLKVAERQSITDELTGLWLKRLKDFLYEVSDMIDEFEADTQAITQPSARKFSFKKYLAFMIPCLTIGPNITMANRMKNMRDDLKVITDQHKEFKLTDCTNANEPKVTDIRETSSTPETEITGRTKERDIILASLSDSMTKDITILPIYGIGGLGKTTLAKMVYNSSQFNEYSQVWVYVSQTFDLIKIGNSIISQLSGKDKESGYTGKQMIHNSLEKVLANKKILIVLDDLWEDNISLLEELKDMLKVGESNKVVVIATTRSEGIAKKMSTIQPYKLAPLTDNMCWSIIKQKSAFESRGDKEQLEEIGKVIAMKCAGVALAAQSLGHTLQSMKSGQWESVRDSNIWTAPSLEDTSSTQVLASLKLSYSVLPSYLKLCFAYCAIFPKGHKILKDDLVHQWVSLGFTSWELGQRYINQLLGLSFLDPFKSPSTFELYDEDVILLTMHDLVHDLATSVMEDEIIFVDKVNNAERSHYHYALLDDCSKPLGSDLSKIRALRFMGCDKYKLHDDAFSSAKSLRVLDLSECTIHKLAYCIGDLKQLRYLNTPRVQDTKIPDSITKLSKLIYLNLHGSPTILALPESIGEIEGLLYLDLSSCSGITKLPKSFRRLQKLAHLNLSNCSSVEGISVFLESLTQLEYLNLSYCPNIGDIPEVLGSLSKLQYLNLSSSSYLECGKEAEFLGALKKLEYLNLSSRECGLKKLPESLGGFSQLKYLNLSGWGDMKKLPRLFGSLKNLLHLDLSCCYMVDGVHEALVGLTSLQHLNLQDTQLISLPDDLTNLRYLKLSRMRNISVDTFNGAETWDSLINHICNNLSDLEHLDLSRNTNIERIPESICSLTKLHTLDLSHCYLLKMLPESISAIGSLRFLYLNGCGLVSSISQLGGITISLPHFVVRAAADGSSSNLVLLKPTNPFELEITELENVKSAGEARSIKLMEKKGIRELKLEWTRGVDRFVDDKMLLEKLVPPSTLSELEICGYNSVIFPGWVVGQLPNLDSLVLRDMANLEEWDTSYSTGEENVLSEVQIHGCPMLRMKGPLPKSEKWEIISSDNVLSSWDECIVSHTSASSSSSRVTTWLSVRDCKVPLHEWRLLRHFPGLPSLSINNCGDLTGSPEITQHLSSLKTLWLQDEDMEELPIWLGELPSLKNLHIQYSSGVKELNENMRQLIKLESLELGFCHSISVVPQWLGELTSLKKLWISNNGCLRSLPASIQQLTSLQEIVLFNCDALQHVVAETEEGKMKLADNQQRESALPTSLKSLYLTGCDGIKSFPEGIHQLTNLQHLEIISCPGLKEWCELEETKTFLDRIEKKRIEF
ncbi:putative disease resistance protein RGA1 [Triticum dicoccoides]|uniref:putative disease resistance protein RGA1 n=1 Tax=Triticum dicoccoides TaxID=85692 RepID=UPI000E7A0AEC|nr:putative disease resistance protein RGA1 [Triticum dicoccoides]